MGLELLMLHIINLLCCCRTAAFGHILRRRLASHRILSMAACVYDAFMTAFIILANRVELRLLLVLHLKPHAGNRLDR